MAALEWIQGTLLGNVATTAAVIAVAVVGFLMLTGRIEWRRGPDRRDRLLHHLRRRRDRRGHPLGGQADCTDAMARLASDPIFAR